MQVFHAPHVLLYAVSIAGVAAIAYAQSTDPASPSTPNRPLDAPETIEFPVEIEPETGTPGYNWDAMLDCADCENQRVSYPFAEGPRYSQVVVKKRQPGGSDTVINCSILSPKRTLNWEYVKTHSWGVSGSATAGIETTLQLGLLERVIADGKVKATGSITIGGSLAGVEQHTFGSSLELTVPPCLGVKVDELYDEYEAVAWQSSGTLYSCEYESPVDGRPVLAACFTPEDTVKAHGRGGHSSTLVIDDFAPCGDDCEDPRDRAEVERYVGELYEQTTQP